MLNELYPWVLAALFIFALLVFVSLFFVSAPYGRFLRAGWGPSISSKWAWILQEFPAFATILILFIYFEAWSNPVSWVFLLIWESHYFHRTFIYPFTTHGKSKPYPLLLVVFAIIFNCMNGFVNGYFLFHLATYGPEWLTGIPFITGIGIFILGFILNKNSDAILRALKRKNAGSYSIPRNGFFKYVSCPHYLGEILEWSGWAVLTWSLPGLAFAVFTFANLAPRAISHHAWYREKFSDYPKSRKALIPFLW